MGKESISSVDNERLLVCACVCMFVCESVKRRGTGEEDKISSKGNERFNSRRSQE